MITSTLVTSSDITIPSKVFTSTTTGAPIGGAVVGQTNAITTMVLCNTADPSPSDETTNAVTVSIHLVKSGGSYSASNRVVSKLTIPAGETVFFSDERIVLDSGDEVWISATVANIIAVTVSTLPV